MRQNTPPLLFLLLSFVLSTILCAEHRINNVEELIALSKNMSNSELFCGTTVLLDADLDFSGGYSEEFVPIGVFKVNAISKAFRGVFNGQGHTIKNLKVNLTEEAIGLFGYSTGTTIQNIVIEDSCSFTSPLSSTDSNVYSYIGSILGFCHSPLEPCIIENAVNMARVSFDGNITGTLFIGGFSGGITSQDYPSIIKNCVNYGSITHSGACGYASEMGGIVGISEGKTEQHFLIQNCINYGSITHNGTTSYIHAIGGVSGVSEYTFIENCVSSGAMYTNAYNYLIGSVIGNINTYSEIIHCFWTSDVGNFNVYGSTYLKNLVANSSLITINQTILDDLNEYTQKNNTWNKWGMLQMNGGRINSINQKSLVEIQSHFPDPVREGNNFLFWCKDAECNERFNPKTDNISSTNTLYAGWESNALTFDFGNGTVMTQIIKYNDSIEYPKNLKREGLTFNGWDIKPETMPARNITIVAQWVETVVSKAVEIVFDTKDIGPKSEEEMRGEIERFIKLHTDEDFVISEFSSDPTSGETKAIIKFVDPEKASDFVRAVNENKSSDDIIKIIKSVPEEINFSSPILISSLFYLIIMNVLFIHH